MYHLSSLQTRDNCAERLLLKPGGKMSALEVDVSFQLFKLAPVESDDEEEDY